MNRTTELEAGGRYGRRVRNPFRVGPALLAGAVLCAATAAFAAPPAAPQGANGMFARAKAGVAVRNFSDANGNELMRLPADHPLRVYERSQGTPAFWEVEVAGGVPVWVYGEFLQPTNAEGVLLVDGSHVNMRPMPESSPRSMALRSKLQSGTRVVMIERKDPSRALAEDWVKVWAPESARVWVAVDDLTVVPASDSAALQGAQEAWNAAVRKVPTARQAVRQLDQKRAQENAAREAERPIVPQVPNEAVRLLADADERFDAAMGQPETSATTWGEVLTLYRQVTELAPEGTAAAARAAERLRTVEAYRGVAALREAMQAEDAQRQKELASIVAEHERKELVETVFWGRFQGRGWLRSRVEGGERRYFLEWSGETVAEVRCSSERYDLSVFEGSELGLRATTVSPPVAATALTEALPRVLDVMRIEVLSSSARR
jgi:hypothetical protein